MAKLHYSYRELHCKLLTVYIKNFHSSRHCQFSVSFGHSQAVLDSASVDVLSAGPVSVVCHAAGGKRHCQDSGRLSDSNSCHLQAAGRSPVHCQVTSFCVVSKVSCRQCQHQLIVAFPDSSFQSQRYCFFQLLTFFQSLFLSTGMSASLCGTKITSLWGTVSPTF